MLCSESLSLTRSPPTAGDFEEQVKIYENPFITCLQVDGDINDAQDPCRKGF